MRVMGVRRRRCRQAASARSWPRGERTARRSNRDSGARAAKAHRRRFGRPRAAAEALVQPIATGAETDRVERERTSSGAHRSGAPRTLPPPAVELRLRALFRHRRLHNVLLALRSLRPRMTGEAAAGVAATMIGRR
jgi:hypothetical protein